MHLIRFIATYGDSDHWFATSESNFCHSDSTWGRRLFSITSDEAYQINQRFQGGKGRFRNYREWELEYHYSGHCVELSLDHDQTDSIMFAIPPGVIPISDRYLDFDIETIVNWLGEHSTDVWSLGSWAYTGAMPAFIKAEQDLAAFCQRFGVQPALPKGCDRPTVITDLHELLFEERRRHFDEYSRIRKELHALRQDVADLRSRMQTSHPATSS